MRGITASDVIVLMEMVKLAERIKPSQHAKREVLRRYGLEGSPHDRFLTGVFYNIMKYLGPIDKVIKELTDIPEIHIVDPWLRAALRVFTFLLVFETKVVSSRKDKEELVDQFKKRIRDFMIKKTNLMATLYLEKYLKRLVVYKYVPKSEEERLELKYLLPYWFIKRMEELLGEKEAKELFEYFNTPPIISVRVNTLKATVEEVAEALRREGKEVKVSKVVPTVLRFEGPYNFSRSPLFNKGKIVIQEEAAALASIILDPNPGEVVVDLCAAPGGKTTHMAELMRNKGVIYAFDVDDLRLEQLRKNLRRTGTYKIVRVIKRDGREAPDLLGKGIADKVLVDAPCTSEGTIMKNQELRWRINRDDIIKLARLQKELLMAAIELTRPGGRILYTTCALLLEENECIVRNILSIFGDQVRLVPINGPYSEGFIPGTMRAWPHRHKTIGFFYALFERI
ncbi:MAG TPA: NOL1/NOP2/sun family putative RNA methylase [Acidilobales archaeon]|nr:MAG: Fmu (Sun) domain-containing protein [Desulfurococcales archaeon ex4484_42]HDD26830.1 NOL1/NOP2/sun family putative RNA methylase [Acidilobales archaeon]